MARRTKEEIEAEIAARQEQAQADYDSEMRSRAAAEPDTSGEGAGLIGAAETVTAPVKAGSEFAGDVGQFAEDAWETVAGINDYRAKPYYGAIEEAAGHTANLYNLGAKQENAAIIAGNRMGDLGNVAAGAGASYADSIRDAATGYQGDLYGVGDAGMADAYKYAGGLYDAGTYGLDSAARSAAGLERKATGLEAKGDYYGGALESAAGDMMRDPSYAEIAGRSAMDRAASEASARAASARGGNANLMIREAAGITAANNRGLTNDLMAARAKEMADRRALQAQTLDRAGNMAITGRTAGANVSTQAGQLVNQGVNTATNAYDAAGRTVAQGRQQQSGAYQAGADVGLRGQQGAADIGMRGVEDQIDSTGKGADLLTQGYANTADTVGKAATTGMQGQDITAGSWNSANNANAGITTQNANNQSDTTKELLETGGKALAMSDVRAKEDISPISFSRSRTDRRDSSWLDPWANMVSEAAGEPANDRATGMAAGQAAYDANRGSKDLTDPTINRRTLDTINPYTYRYKDDIAEAMGEDTAPRVGIMAQELERSPAGADVTGTGPNGKVIDLNRAASFNLAANAGLNQRLDQLEDDMRAALGDDYGRRYGRPGR